MTSILHPKPLLQTLQGQVLTPPPIWFMRQAGRYLPEYREIRRRVPDFLSLCYSPALAAEVTLQPLRRFPLDAAILFADILLIPDALGQKLVYVEGQGPVLEPIRDVTALARLDRSRLHQRLGPVYETVERVKSRLPEGVALIGFAGAPWTVATYMVCGRGTPDKADTKRWAFEKPEEFQGLIDLLTETTIEYLDRQISAGAEAVQIFDSWAGALDGDALERWCFAPVAKICDALRALHPEVPVIGFPRGIGTGVGQFLSAVQVSGLSLDSDIDPKWAATKLPAQIALQGNLAPQYLVQGGLEMETRTAAILEAMAGRPFIFNLGHGIVPETPPEHVAQLVEFVQAWRK